MTQAQTLARVADGVDKLSQQLAEVEHTLTQHVAAQEQSEAARAETQALLARIVTGDGDPTRGLVIRVDRLEGWRSRFTWWQGALTIATLAVIGRVLASFVTG